MPSRNYYLKERNDTKLMAYQDYITSVATMLAADKLTFSFTKQDVIDMVDFEIELAKVSMCVLVSFAVDQC